MKVYQTQVMFQDEPIFLSVGIGSHTANCTDKATHDWGGGFFNFGDHNDPDWHMYVHGHRFMTGIMHEVVEGLILLHQCLFDQRYGTKSPLIVMSHDEFSVIIDHAAPAMNNIVNAIAEAFDSDMYNLLPPDKTPDGWEIIHDCDPAPEPKRKGKKGSK